jgi:hypothetical protein
MAISVKMLKNKPRIPQPNRLRPFTPAITAHTIAAMMLPIATNTPLIPFRMKPAAADRRYSNRHEATLRPPRRTPSDQAPQPRSPRRSTRRLADVGLPYQAATAAMSRTLAAQIGRPGP